VGCANESYWPGGRYIWNVALEGLNLLRHALYKFFRQIFLFIFGACFQVGAVMHLKLNAPRTKVALALLACEKLGLVWALPARARSSFHHL